GAFSGRLQSIAKNVLIFTDSRSVTELVKRALSLLVIALVTLGRQMVWRPTVQSEMTRSFLQGLRIIVLVAALWLSAFAVMLLDGYTPGAEPVNDPNNVVCWHSLDDGGCSDEFVR